MRVKLVGITVRKYPIHVALHDGQAEDVSIMVVKEQLTPLFSLYEVIYLSLYLCARVKSSNDIGKRVIRPLVMIMFACFFKDLLLNISSKQESLYET